MITRAAARKAGAVADAAYERSSLCDNRYTAAGSIDAAYDNATVCRPINHSDIPPISTPETAAQDTRSPHCTDSRPRMGLLEQVPLPLSPPAEALEASAKHITLESTFKRQQDVQVDLDQGTPTNDKSSTVLSLQTNKRTNGLNRPRMPVRGGWDALPHNLGKLWTSNTESDITTTSANEIYQPAAIGETVVNDTTVSPWSDNFGVADNADSSRAATENGLHQNIIIHSTKIIEPIIELGYASAADEAKVNRQDLGGKGEADDDSRQKRQRSLESPTRVCIRNVQDHVDDAEESKMVKRKARRTKDNPYGLTPGETPYPDWTSPTAQQCQEVYNILAKMHDDVEPLPPDKIPAPSLEVAGCGEVPSILDGLIRTVLSSSTTFESADKMLQALVKRFGILEHGIGKGSVNWNNVRIAEYDDVYEQLKNGGLGKIKAKNIQAILRLVYDENLERRTSYLCGKETGVQADVAGASMKTEGQKKFEFVKTDQEILSLDYMHSMDTHEAMQHFVRYPGVGVKTAACVTLFSLQRPCFAVDTHVFRMSRWLGWVPQKANEDGTFSHLEVRCPDNLKYGLHQLLIRHGKTCHRCNTKSFLDTEAWIQTDCPLEHLINRFTKRAVKPAEVKTREKEGKGKSTASGKRKRQDDNGKTSAEVHSEDDGIQMDSDPTATQEKKDDDAAL